MSCFSRLAIRLCAHHLWNKQVNYGPYTPVVFVPGEGIPANEGVEWGAGKG